MKVKTSYEVSGMPSYIKFYKANDEGSTVGDEISAVISSDLSTLNWSTVTLTLSEATRIAIKAQYVYLDDFTATEVEAVKVPGLSITSVKRADNESTTYFDMNADGTYNVVYKVKVKNTGELPLVSGTTENYTLSVSIDNTLYGSFNVPVDLAVDEESDEFLATIVLPATAPTGWKDRYLAENITGTTDGSSLAWSNTLAYNPVPFFIKKGDEPISKGRDLSSVTSLDFGMISAETTKNYEIFAHNAGDLQIKNITVTGDFSVAPAETLPYTITAHTGMYLNVTANATETSAGTLTITYVNKNGEDATLVVILNQIVLDPSKWVATFDGGTWPEGTIHQSSLTLSTNTYYGYDNAIKSNSSSNNKFFTPLLHTTAGESMTFDAMLDYNSGTVKVYVTTDRNNLGTPVLSLSNSQLNTSTMTSQSVTIAEEGDYYVVFEVCNAMLDNLYGFEPVTVTHDIMVNSYLLNGYIAADQTIQTGDVIKPTFEILSVQAETADAYSVKFYVGEDAMATAEAVDLTAGTTKKFTFEYTPNLTATATFDTYAAIEFTDGTVVKSDVQKLTVTCEPVFVFFNAGTTVGSSKPSNRSTAITFGTVQENNQVQNFEIFNWGTTVLTVKSITVPEGFSVNVSEATVAPKERQAVNITFSATTPNSYSGNLTITYEDAEGADQTFELPVSGKLLDATLWYADFGTENNNSGLPAGSLVQANISCATPTTGNAALKSTSSSNNLFITPLFNITEGEEMSFKAYQTSSGNVKVYLVQDHIAAAQAKTDEEFAALNPTLIQEFSISGNSFESYSFTLPTTGNYYVAFKIQNAYIDELYGLTLADVEHDWMIASSNIPTDAMQNYTSTATVNILNLGLQDEAAEDITVTAYVNGEAVATAEGVAIPMNHKLNDAGTQLSVSYMVNEAGTFPVYVEVKAGEYSVATEPVDVTFAEEVAISGVQVGTKSTTNTSVPFYTSWMDDSSGKSMSDFIYTPEQLAVFGISAGAKIKSITFVGTPSGTKTINSLTTEVWVAQQAVSDFTAGSPDKDNMTYVKLHDAESVTFTSGTAYEFKINFTEPIVYDGNSGIRIFTNINGNGQYQSINFDVDGNYQNAYYAHGTGSFTSKVGNPVAYFELDATTATLAGTVTTSANAGIEGATVTLKAENGVQYSGTTDADGAYSINVIQAGLDFTATIEAEGFLKKEFALNMNGTSMTQPVVLFKQFGLVGTMPGFNGWDNDMVMTQSTEDPNIFTLEMNDIEVTAEVYAFKLRADGAWDLPSGYYKPNFDNGIDEGNGYNVSGGNYQWNFETSGTYNFLFTFDLSTSTLTFERPFLLAENAEGVADLNWVDVTVEREFKAGWNAVVLPFAMTAAEVTEAFGEKSELAVYDGDEGTGSVTVHFKKIEGNDKFISAGYPYMLWLEAPVSGLKFTKNISSTLTTAPGTNFDFVGVYATTDVDAGDYFVAGGVFKRATTNNTVKPFRAYLKAKTAGVRSINFVVNDGGISTAIDNLEIEGLNNAEGAYNLSGQKVQTLNRKGLYIINGKKVYVK
jgi:hypothetical protein